MRYFVIIFLIFISCGGTRNTDITKQESFQVINSYTTGEKTVLGSTFIYEPVDPLKPYIVEGKEFKNVKILQSNTKTVEKWKIKIIYRTKIVYRTKIIYRKNDAYLWIGVVAVIGILIFLYLYLPKIKIPFQK